MVSSQYYIKRFFSAMPQRFKLIKELRETKSKVDSKILVGKGLSSGDINTLINIIGKDAIFRRAEKRNKPTLRHVSWKLLKSIKAFYELKEDINPSKIQKEFRAKIMYLVEFLQERLPYLEKFLDGLDKVYAKEANTLGKILEGKLAIDSYKELLQEEQQIMIQAEPYFSNLKERTLTLSNIIREFEQYFATQKYGFSVGETITGYYLTSLGLGITLVLGIASFFVPNSYVNPTWAIFLTVAGSGLLATSINDKIKKFSETLI